jgi:4-hydroxy-tetrahydrodipicolinate synthase
VTDRFGLSAALTTPFAADGTLDLPRLAGHARWCLANGCDSITAFGTTGEGTSVALDERLQALGALAGAGITGRDVVYCIAANAVQEALEHGRLAADFGCRGILLTPPSYFKGVSDEGLFAWLSAVLDRLGTRAGGVILYNIPSVTQIPLSIDLVGRLKEAYPGVVTGVKDSSGDWPYTQQLLAAHSDLAILIGDERYLAEGVRRGGQGAISGLANVVPGVLVRLARDGQGDERINRLVDEVLKYPVTPVVKALVARRTGDAAWRNVRTPLVPTPDADVTAIGAVYDSLFAT